jgi:hypothetical protein
MYLLYRLQCSYDPPRLLGAVAETAEDHDVAQSGQEIVDLLFTLGYNQDPP